MVAYHPGPNHDVSMHHHISYGIRFFSWNAMLCFYLKIDFYLICSLFHTIFTKLQSIACVQATPRALQGGTVQSLSLRPHISAQRVGAFCALLVSNDCRADEIGMLPSPNPVTD